MLTPFKPAQLLASTLLLNAFFAVGCHAQTAGAKLSPEMARRIELTIRAKAALPFNYIVKVTDRRKSAVDGYDDVSVLVTEDGKAPHTMTFLLAKDEKSIAQLNSFELKDPRTLVSDAGRPARGGSEKAPVTIVVFDDLECPFCARMHAQMFPALLARYGDKVRVAYKDFPLSQHPWAIHAAVDADCLGTQSSPAYWSLVDYLHLHANDLGDDTRIPVTVTNGPLAPADADAKKLAIAKAQLDKLTTEEGNRVKLDNTKLQACLARQDEAPVLAGLHEGETLSVSGVPALFINGEQITGAVPIEYVYRAVDAALVAQGLVPPPPVTLPSLDGAGSSK